MWEKGFHQCHDIRTAGLLELADYSNMFISVRLHGVSNANESDSMNLMKKLSGKR